MRSGQGLAVKAPAAIVKREMVSNRIRFKANLLI